MMINADIVNIPGYVCLPITADFNECQSNTDNCNVSANCTNTPGSFFCTCKPGYTGDGVIRCDGKIWFALWLCSHSSDSVLSGLLNMLRILQMHS